MQQQQQATNAQVTSNLAYVGATALQVRLNTDKIIYDIKQYLEGHIELLKEKEDGTVFYQKLSVGVPKANALGVQEILSRVRLVVNPAYVQGNFDVDRYNREIKQLRMALSEDLMTNLNRYDIDEGDYSGIVNGILHLLKGFVSRLIDNKERESYETTMRHVETNTQQIGKNRGIL